MSTLRSHRSRPRTQRTPFSRHRPDLARLKPAVEPLEARELLATLFVTTSNDTNDPTGPNLSLRLAIQVANGTLLISSLSPAMQTDVVGPLTFPTPNTIDFNLPGAAPQKISVNSALPTITEPLDINGYSQPGSALDTVLHQDEDINNPTVQIDGSALAIASPATIADGLDIVAPNCSVSGLIITGFTGIGVSISGAGSQGNAIFSDFIGAMPDVATGHNFLSPALGNLTAGIKVTASNNVIGGDSPEDRVVIANNTTGVILASTSGTGDILRDNFILNNAGVGLLMTSSNNEIGDLTGAGPNVISGNGGSGVVIDGTGGGFVQGNIIESNVIGGDVGVLGTNIVIGQLALPNGGFGVDIESSANNTVGGLLANGLNVIGNSGLDGITINGVASTGNRILHNFIGFNQIGGADFIFPNQNGISITSSGNFIGGTTSAAQNTISNNRFQGILLTGAGAFGNTLEGNVIGLNPGGGNIEGNSQNGIDLENAPNNTIGGTNAGEGNTISGNNNGIVLNGAGSTGDLIEGNFIGTGKDGVTDLGNAVDGVVINGAPLNTIGGSTAGAGNVISGNNRGIVVTGVQASGTIIQGNFIGTDLTATEFVGNEIDGILITAGASAGLIGGTVPGEGNTIAFNAGRGINLDSGVSNGIRGNSIFSNTAGGIFLNPVTSADNLQPAPVLTAASPNGPGINIQGKITAAPVTTYAIDFFSSPTQDSPGVAEGKTYLGSTTVTTDVNGLATFNINLAVAVPSGNFVTATATEPVSDNSSTFSNAIPAVATQLEFSMAAFSANENGNTATITVTRTGGTGGAVSVAFATGGGTAVAGVDYIAASGTLFFSAGDTTKTFPVTILNPGKIGGSTTLNLTLSAPSNGATLGVPSTATLTIQDNDGPSLSLSSATYTVNQSAGSLIVTVDRNIATGTSTVNFATGNGTAIPGVNYQPTSGTLTFKPGDTIKTFTVPVFNDHLIHGPRTFTVSLSSPTGAVIEPPIVATVTEIDNETAGALQLQASALSSAPGATSVPITVVRANGAAGTVSVTFATGGGTAKPGVDYTPVTGTLTFGPGVTSQTFSVPLLNASTPGVSATFDVALSHPTGTAVLGSPTLALVTIRHAPPPPPPPPGPAPTITAVNVLANGAGVVGIQFTFDMAMNAALASNPASYGYFFLNAGGDNVFGSPDDGFTPIAAASYNASTLTATVVPTAPLALNFLDRLILDPAATVAQGVGLRSATGTFLASNVPGSPMYIVTFGVGTHLSYYDRSADAVSLALTGPGLMTIQLDPTGNDQSVRLSGTSAGRTTLSGQLHPTVQGQGGTTPIPVITGAAGVKIALKSPPFQIGGISAAAFDALAGSGRLKTRRH